MIYDVLIYFYETGMRNEIKLKPATVCLGSLVITLTKVYVEPLLTGVAYLQKCLIIEWGRVNTDFRMKTSMQIKSATQAVNNTKVSHRKLIAYGHGLNLY